MRSEQEVEQAIDLHSDMIRRICLLHLNSHEDTEDVLQEVFLKYVLHSAVFESQEHEKAWLIRVTLNACKEEAASVMPEQMGILEIVLSLPVKYKDVIYLHYYEGYTAKEIGTMLHKKENTVYSLLSRGRELLKQKLGGDRNV